MPACQVGGWRHREEERRTKKFNLPQLTARGCFDGGEVVAVAAVAAVAAVVVAAAVVAFVAAAVAAAAIVIAAPVLQLLL